VNLEKSKPEINPKNVMGWDVQQSKDGYYLCYRKQVNTKNIEFDPELKKNITSSLLWSIYNKY